MSKFKAGDRVRIVESCLGDSSAGLAVVGDTGTLIRITEKPYPYAVHRDANPDPSSIHWCAKIELIQQPVIVITTDGKTTTATKRLGKKVLGTATARCNPGDKFDFDIGAAIAMARLCGGEVRFHVEEEKPVPEKDPLPEKPKNFNCKVVCVDSRKSWWTKGKIYEIIDGTIYDDEGDYRGLFEDLDDLRSRISAKFIPLVED